MRSKQWKLVRTLLAASGTVNILRYEKDGKKRRRAVGTLIGSVILYVFFAALFFAMAYGMGSYGMAEGVPAVCALLISAMELIFGVLRAGDYIFSRKDYEILMALPFTPKQLVSAKFIAMYIRNIPSSIVSSLAMMAGYALIVKPAAYVYVIWIILSFVVPLIPTVAASAIGVLSAGIGSRAKHKTAVQSAFVFIFTIAIIFVSQIAGRFFSSSEQVNAALTTISNIGDTAGGAYLPVRWFSDAVVKADPLSILLLIAVSVAVFELVFLLISRGFRKINSRLITVNTSGKTFKKTDLSSAKAMKTRSVVNAIAFKEWRRFLGSTIYLTNTGIGYIIVLIMSVVVLFVDMNWLLSVITRGAPVTADVFIPGVPLILFFFIGMAPTTVVSWSLEGRNFWILQSLPITRKDICRGKMIFNIRLSLPFITLGSICFGIALRVSVPIVLLFLLCGIVLCLYSTFYGMYCNLKHENMDWDKEAEVVKQGSAVMFYLLPNMFITMAAATASLVFGMRAGAVPVLLIVSAVYAGVAFIFYKKVGKLTG